MSVVPAESALANLKKYWGYESLLPFQSEAIETIFHKRDSLVILPTGGGKSVCYQLPVLSQDGTAVVISPLVSLMKDQVDTLRGLGIPAGYINSTLSEQERSDTIALLRQGYFKLLYLAPERLTAGDFIGLLQQCDIAYFVIDEAHCISQWGHDFRDAYRRLSRLRDEFPGKSIHAFTATATTPVRNDIISALKLNDPDLLIGNFERPNLLYRVQYRVNLMKQLMEIIERHPDEGGIIYCISRKEVEETAKALKGKGLSVLPYHAGLSDGERQRNQEAFIQEEVNIVVATVAFGMGIDRSNIRYVVHTGMPQSIEHYQQEAGRAGRDRLNAECVLLYSGADVAKWRSIKGAPQTETEQVALDKLYEMSNYCRRLVCRHRFLVEYFGQDFTKANCAHCDFCRGEYELLPDALTVAQKVLSCVLRVNERFGAHHVSGVLKGSASEKIRQFGHDQLSTYGLLSDYRQDDILQWIEQLVSQDFLQKTDEYNILQLTPAGRLLLKGEGDVMLAKPVKPARSERQRDKSGKRASSDASLTEDDAALFEALRKKRSRLAYEQRVPPYIIFSDLSLKEMARQKPQSIQAFRQIKGVGEVKLETVCPHFLAVILEFLESSGTPLSSPVSSTPSERSLASQSGINATSLFASPESATVAKDVTPSASVPVSPAANRADASSRSRSAPSNLTPVQSNIWSLDDILSAPASETATLARQPEMPSLPIFPNDTAPLLHVSEAEGVWEATLQSQSTNEVSYATDGGLDLAAKPDETTAQQAMRLFSQGATFEQVLTATGRVQQTVLEYLCNYLRAYQITAVEPWVMIPHYTRICSAVLAVGAQKLKPIQELLEQESPHDPIDYDEIKVALAIIENRLKI